MKTSKKTEKNLTKTPRKQSENNSENICKKLLQSHAKTGKHVVRPLPANMWKPYVDLALTVAVLPCVGPTKVTLCCGSDQPRAVCHRGCSDCCCSEACLLTAHFLRLRLSHLRHQTIFGPRVCQPIL